ncbi:uncharacterized protein LOC123502730 [Portunus trituberculatus]|uniref:C2H2-type domain-containing protein n=1 Tax=Portunus trituberculatus TaxID=210409 RepID=A0A5B7FT73_PORTR|nr:uncharacterized protein LOC123502730 [Portunus trituberculatus]MPC48243.1 hypothetical protein [Portunus trituberculatus]
MVDWGLAGRGEMHVRRMHAAARHPSRLPPPAASATTATMLQEDEVELNAMDFVETEYKSDAGEGEPGRPGVKRKKVRSKPQGSQGRGNSASRPMGEVEPPGEEGKAAHKRRKRKHTQRPREQSSGAANMGLYPYAAFLKKLCDKVGSSHGCSESLPARIFNQLRHTEVHYPYASLLQALHRHAGVGPGAASSPSTVRDQPPSTLEVARVMRNLRYPTGPPRGSSREDGEDPVAPFSAVLMAMVMKEQLHSQAPGGPGLSVGGIGEILRKEMPHSQKDDPPPSELSSASLLQKLSLSAERDLEAARGSSTRGKAQQAPTWTSTESSQSEEEDLDWRPTHWLAKKVSKDAAAPVKRKSNRRKSSSCDLEVEQPKTSQGDLDAPTQGEVRAGLQQCSGAARAKLLQFIMSRQQQTPDKRGKRARKRAKVTRINTKVARVKGKRKHSSAADEACDTIWVANGILEGQTTATEEEANHAAAGEPQSLLKEYLLKPAGEEVIPSENCDIPKLESNFLFSRLLQNFKSLAESNQVEEPSKKSSDCSRGPSILRGMLAATTPAPEQEHKFSPSDHNTSSSSSEHHHHHHHHQHTQKQKQQAGTPPPLGEPPLRVKLEEEIKVECEDEIVCKVECEEDSFECQVCHLQFSSLTDLSNHQVLFHCSEEPQAPASHRLLGCSVEGLGGGVMQGKQPA